MKITREVFSETSSWNESSPLKSLAVSTGPRRKSAGCPGVSVPAAYRRRRLSVEFHFRRKFAVDDDSRCKDEYRDEVGSGLKRRVGLGGNNNLLGARQDLVGGVVKDRPPPLKVVVLAIADKQSPRRHRIPA